MTDRPKPRPARISFGAQALAMLMGHTRQAAMLERVGGHREGPGKKTLMSMHNYIHDPRRKNWAKCRWGSRP